MGLHSLIPPTPPDQWLRKTEEIVKRIDDTVSFVVLPRLRIAARTAPWYGNHHRPAALRVATSVASSFPFFWPTYFFWFQKMKNAVKSLICLPSAWGAVSIAIDIYRFIEIDDCLDRGNVWDYQFHNCRDG